MRNSRLAFILTREMEASISLTKLAFFKPIHSILIVREFFLHGYFKYEYIIWHVFPWCSGHHMRKVPNSILGGNKMNLLKCIGARKPIKQF